jgi:hypothetical protein
MWRRVQEAETRVTGRERTRTFVRGDGRRIAVNLRGDQSINQIDRQGLKSTPDAASQMPRTSYFAEKES